MGLRMTLPANIRVNTAVPFPALVLPSGPITLAKNNGVWTIGFTITAFGSQVPLVPNYPTDFLLAWDDVNKTFFKVSITNLLSSINLSLGAARTQRTVTASPIVFQSTDQIVSTKIAGAAAGTLPSAVSRVGVPLTIKDLGQATAHPITLTPAGGDLIDGAASIVIAANFQSVTLVPFNDGTNTGWMIQ
jgi:hypothetical protein